jgi:hypothetical protein
MKNYIKNTKRRNDSYLSDSHRKRKQYLIRLGIPIVAAAIVLGILLSLQTREHGIGVRIILHIHPHLNITANGSPLTIPKNVGIDPSLYKDHILDRYGMQEMAPLHTHDTSGTINVESTVNRNYTLGEFLKIWGGLNLNGKIVKASVDGKPISNFRNHAFKNGEQIKLEIEVK